MWQLLANGLNLVANASGVYSFVRGFSVERNMRQMQAAIARLEKFNEELRHPSSKNFGAATELAPLIEEFIGQQNSLRRLQAKAEFESLTSQLSRGIPDASVPFLTNVHRSMQTALASVHVSHGHSAAAPPELLHSILRDPGRAGLTRMWDVTAGGLSSVERPTILTSQFAPIFWDDPRTRRSFLGEMPLRLLSGYGVSVRAPEYRYHADGHIFSERYGLYVPYDFS